VSVCRVVDAAARESALKTMVPEAASLRTVKWIIRTMVEIASGRSDSDYFDIEEFLRDYTFCAGLSDGSDCLHLQAPPQNPLRPAAGKRAGACALLSRLLRTAARCCGQSQSLRRETVKQKNV
jgi:hypothetical protein